MSKPLKFAVIGCGMLAQSMHIPNLAKNPKAVLHTCCDLSDEALESCRKRGARKLTKDWRQALADPEVDAACVATTQSLRLPIIAMAAELGKPLYVEKPVAPTLQELYEIQRIVRQAGIHFCAGHNRRCSPAMIEARRIFRAHMTDAKPCPWRFDREGHGRPALKGDGVAGMSVRINDDWYSWKGWVFDKEQSPYGPMLFEMTHYTDMCNWFLAAKPAEVVAIEASMLNHGIVIRYETGEVATISMCANGTFGYPKELYEVFGNGGAVVVDHMLEVRTAGIEGVSSRIIFPMEGEDRHPNVGKEGGLPGWLEKKRAACADAVAKHDSGLVLDTAGPDKGHAHALDHFIDEINGRGPVVCGVDDAVEATRVAFAALKSAHEHRAVNMNET